MGSAARAKKSFVIAQLACLVRHWAAFIIALLYTTPWDNYLVATGVWWYDPALVTGLTLGWVPIEEYTFFILQTLLAGLWLAFLARRLEFKDQSSPRPCAYGFLYFWGWCG